MTALTSLGETADPVIARPISPTITSRLIFVNGHWDLPEWADSPIVDDCAPWPER